MLMFKCKNTLVHKDAEYHVLMMCISVYTSISCTPCQQKWLPKTLRHINPFFLFYPYIYTCTHICMSHSSKPFPFPSPITTEVFLRSWHDCSTIGRSSTMPHSGEVQPSGGTHEVVCWSSSQGHPMESPQKVGVSKSFQCQGPFRKSEVWKDIIKSAPHKNCFGKIHPKSEKHLIRQKGTCPNFS